MGRSRTGDRLSRHRVGFPVADDTRLFEKICLEGFQSGLSWRTILLKRDNFRTAFAGFDIPTVAGFGERDVERLLGDAGIVRHRGKINAAINNAARALELIDEAGSLATFVWQFEPENADRTAAEPVSTSPESVALSKALRSVAGSSSDRPPCTRSCSRWGGQRSLGGLPHL